MWRGCSSILIALFIASTFCPAQQSADPSQGSNATPSSPAAVNQTQLPAAPGSTSDAQSTNAPAPSNAQTSQPAPPQQDAAPAPASPAPAINASSAVSPTASAGAADSLPPTGFSSYISMSGEHDSSTGWSKVLNSSLRYDFNSIFGMELGVPFYLMHNGYDAVAVTGKKNPPIVTSYNSLGDVDLSLNFAAPNSAVGYRSTLVGTGPTGDTSSGISTGRPTFDFNNHFDHGFGPVSPLIELGFGDSSTLVNKRVRRPFTTLGPLSHFTAGAAFDLFKGSSFQADAYEHLPVGSQKIYRTEYVRVRTSTGAFRLVRRRRSFQGISEDNGCEGTLGASLGQHVDLSATYDRSFRQKLDTVSITLGFRIGKSQPNHKTQ